MAKRWKAEEITYLKRYAKRRTLEELAERFRTDSTEVQSELTELGLAAKNSVAPVNLATDPSVKLFEKGVRSLHRGKYEESRKILEEVMIGTDILDLAQRARRYLAVCNEHLQSGKSTDDEDPFLVAVYERNRGNLEGALELCSRGGRQSKDERFAYLAAALHSLKGDLDQAAKFLSLAVEMNPVNRVRALHDSDFAALESDPEHSRLFKKA
jgi:tetratricopeptide (TPR) repeat protein